jgi:hypothetical protein
VSPVRNRVILFRMSAGKNMPMYESRATGTMIDSLR